MKLYIEMTYEEFTVRFKRDVRNISYYHVNPSLYGTPLALFNKWSSINNEFIGDIKGENFWLQRTKPRLSPSYFPRQFVGRVKREGKGISISGRFKIVSEMRLIPYLAFSFATICFILRLAGRISGIIELLVGIPVLCILFFLFNLLIKRVHMDVDQAVIAYLEGLRDEYANKAAEHERTHPELSEFDRDFMR